jgi:hypothetical protein
MLGHVSNEHPEVTAATGNRSSFVDEIATGAETFGGTKSARRIREATIHAKAMTAVSSFISG